MNQEIREEIRTLKASLKKVRLDDRLARRDLAREIKSAYRLQQKLQQEYARMENRTCALGIKIEKRLAILAGRLS